MCGAQEGGGQNVRRLAFPSRFCGHARTFTAACAEQKSARLCASLLRLVPSFWSWFQAYL